MTETNNPGIGDIVATLLSLAENVAYGDPLCKVHDARRVTQRLPHNAEASFIWHSPSPQLRLSSRVIARERAYAKHILYSKVEA